MRHDGIVESAAEPGNLRVGPPGLLIFRGSTVAIKDFELSFDAHGSLTSSMRPQIAWELWPLWLRVAIDHETLATVARCELMGADGADNDRRRADLVEEETRAGLVAITAAAFALEAMALSAAARAGLQAGIGRSASAGRRIAEVLKQCFVIPVDRFADWRRSIVEIFGARNAAVHPDAGLQDPMPHPALHAAVPRPAHIYRLENTSAAITAALTTARVASSSPRPRLGKQFREGIAGWASFVEELYAQRDALVAADLSTTPPIDER